MFQKIMELIYVPLKQFVIISLVQIHQVVNYGALGFYYMYIKASINWDLNQTKIVGVDPQLSYDVISNEFKKYHQIFMRILLNLMMRQ